MISIQRIRDGLHPLELYRGGTVIRNIMVLCFKFQMLPEIVYSLHIFTSFISSFMASFSIYFALDAFVYDGNERI